MMGALPDWMEDDSGGSAPPPEDTLRAPAKALPSWMEEEAAPEPGMAATALHHGAQGLTAGFSDELAGVGASTLGNLRRIKEQVGERLAGKPGVGIVQSAKNAWGAMTGDYTRARDEERATLDATEKAHPAVAFGSNLAGGMAGAALTGGASMGVRGAAAMGALSGFGSSRADNVGEQVQDALLGAGTGVVAHGIGKGIGKALGFPGNLARKGVATAETEIGQKAARGVDEAIASARGELGGEVQKGNRLAENMMRLEPEMNTGQAQSLAAQKAARDALNARLIDSNLKDLPGQAGVIAGKDAALAALVQNRTPAIAAAEEGLRKAGPGQLLGAPLGAAGGALKNRWTSMAGGGAGAVLGSAFGPAGAAAGAVAGSSAGHALGGALQNPESRRTLYLGIGRLLAAPDALGKYAPSLAAAYARGPDALAATHAVLLKRDPEYQRTLDQAQGGQ